MVNVHQRANKSCRKGTRLEHTQAFLAPMDGQLAREKALFPCMQEAADNPLKNMAILYILCSVQG